jgi:hypothetical protein
MLDPMAKKSETILPDLVQSNVRMPQVTLDRLDAWVDEMNVAAGWKKFTRSDLIRNIVDEALEAHDRAKEAKP